jgi:hypothetical protein
MHVGDRGGVIDAMKQDRAGNIVGQVAGNTAWMIDSSPMLAAFACRFGMRSVSSSIAVNLPAAASSGNVSAPSPGPISTRKSSARGEMALTMRSM